MKYNAETIEKILANDITRYIFLVSLISADTILRKDDCLNSLETFDYIYNNMNVIQYESDSEPFKFVEDINYDSEILGEVKQIFKLNINYNQEILGMV